MPFDGIKRPGPERGAHERAINLPPTILWIIGLNVAVQLVRQLLSESVDQQMILQFGLVPAAYTGELGSDWLSLIEAPFTYQFLHGGWVHLGVNMLTLAAFGAPVERLLRPARFVAFYLTAGLAAGAIHILSFPDSLDPVVGASGAISGVFGAVLILLWRAGRMPSLLPVAGVWIALNVFFGVFGGMPGAGGESIAWTAHIGGFVYGLAVIRLFVPRLPGPPEVSSEHDAHRGGPPGGPPGDEA
jgi:membrane associated rhomboid family serine protease